MVLYKDDVKETCECIKQGVVEMSISEKVKNLCLISDANKKGGTARRLKRLTKINHFNQGYEDKHYETHKRLRAKLKARQNAKE